MEHQDEYPLLESLLNLHVDRGPDISDADDSIHQFAEALAEVTTISFISDKIRYQETIIRELKAKIEKIIDSASHEATQVENITSKLVALAELVSRIQKSVSNQNYLMRKLNAGDNGDGRIIQ